MKSALERMDELITITLNSDPGCTVNLSEELANCHVRLAMTEKDNIRKELMYSPSVFRNIGEMQLHITHYQCVITYLADRVTALRAQNTESIPGKFYTELMRILFDLLGFIHQRFSYYVDRDAKMPLELQEIKRKQLQRLLLQFSAVFNNEMDDLPLYSAVTKPITSFLQAEVHELFSYSKTDYLFHYISALNHLPAKTKSPVMELIAILVRMNCNSIMLKKYIINKMKAEIQNCRSGKQVVSKLDDWQDFFREISVRLNMVFNKNSLYLKEEMLGWIELRLLKELNGRGGKPDKLNQSTEKTEETGLLYMMTVEELALLKRVERESGFLSNRNTTEMMRELAPFLHTTKQYDVSWQNLYNCFYTLDIGTIKSLTEKMFVMSRTLHQLELTLKKKSTTVKK